ncbi:MAG: glucosaminidase domain-containing protein [Bacilli bacterium]|nr:glucosaminidase domain-containing protein [Bacilli bacterium]
MGNIKKLNKILKDKKEIITNLILIVLTVVITFNAVQLYRANKTDKQEKVEKKQVQQYNGQELLQPTVEDNVVEEEQNTEQQPETNISEQTIQEEIKEVENVKTSVGYSSTVTPETMKIMGYEEIDADKAITFIVNLVGEDNIDKIKLNGTSLNFHISNTNKAAKAEDVNAYFVLAQQLLETGNLKFENSSVKPEYYNFAGLGATDSKPNPNKFFSNYEGQLAQVQHLKGYATTDPLKEECKDQRFTLLMNKRGTAVNAAELSNKWASNSSYGELLAEMYNQFHNTEVNSEIVSKYKYKTL